MTDAQLRIMRTATASLKLKDDNYVCISLSLSLHFLLKWMFKFLCSLNRATATFLWVNLHWCCLYPWQRNLVGHLQFIFCVRAMKFQNGSTIKPRGLQYMSSFLHIGLTQTSWVLLYVLLLHSRATPVTGVCILGVKPISKQTWVKAMNPVVVCMVGVGGRVEPELLARSMCCCGMT